MNFTNYEGVSLKLIESRDEYKFQVVISNQGDIDLWCIQFNLHDLMGFGFDDTYLKVKSECDIFIVPKLNAFESITFTNVMVGNLEHYRGASCEHLYATYSPREDCQVKYGMLIGYSIVRCDGTAFVAHRGWVSKGYSDSYIKGYQFALFLKKTFRLK